MTSGLFSRSAANPILTADDWPIESTPSSILQRSSSTARPCSSRVSKTALASRISPSRARRTVSTAGTSTPSRSSRPRLATRRGVGVRRRTCRLGRGAATVRDHLHGVRPGRTGRLPGDIHRLLVRRAARHHRHARGQERCAPARASRRQVDSLPPPDLAFAPSGSGISLSRSADLRTGARRSSCFSLATAPGGTRSASGSGRRCSRPTTAGSSSTTASRRPSWAAIYRVGLALLDLDEPTRILRRADGWVLAPTEPYERTGDVPNAIFPCGLIHDQERGELRLYYGAADTSICVATASYAEVLATVRAG